MAKAQTPPWVAFLNPIIGVLGVIVGERMALAVTPPPAADPAPSARTAAP